MNTWARCDLGGVERLFATIAGLIHPHHSEKRTVLVETVANPCRNRKCDQLNGSIVVVYPGQSAVRMRLGRCLALALKF